MYKPGLEEQVLYLKISLSLPWRQSIDLSGNKILIPLRRAVEMRGVQHDELGKFCSRERT
jgi:hypothetical protein